MGQPAAPQSRLFPRFAVAMFYLFLALFGFLGTLDLPRADLQTDLAAVGLASAALMWWLSDSMQRKRPIAMMSLWIPFQYWMVVVPSYYVSTRGRAGIWRLLAHLLAAAAVCAGAAVAGDLLAGR